MQQCRVNTISNFKVWGQHSGPDLDVMDNPSSIITQVSRDEEGNKASGERGSSPSLSSKKPRSRGLFSSLLCCLCRDQPEPQPVNNNAPLLVEENGTVSKVCFPVSFFFLSHWSHSLCCFDSDGMDKICVCIFRLNIMLWDLKFFFIFLIQVKPLLPPVKSKDSGKICVVIDLDETLVHSSFKVRRMRKNIIALITSSYVQE